MRLAVFGLAIALVALGCDAPDASNDSAGVPVQSVAEPSTTAFDESGLGIRRSIHPGEAHRYEMALGAGESIHYRVDQLGSDVFLRLVDKQEATLIQIDSRTANQDGEDLYFVIEEGGRYSLVVQAFKSNSEPGEYLATILDRRPATIEDRKHVAAEKLFASAYSRIETGPLGAEAGSVITELERAAEIWQGLGNRDRQADALYELAPVYRESNDSEKALEAYQKLQSLFPQPSLQAVFYNELGRLWQETGDPARARAGFLRAKRLFQSLDDRWNEAVTLHNLARLDSREGRPADALGRLHEARGLWEELDDRIQLAHTLNAIGEAYTKLGDTESAVGHHRQALALLDPRAETLDRATTFCFMADAVLEARELDQATELFTECLRLRELGGASTAALARAGNGLGVIEMRRGYPDRALEHFGRSLAIFEADDSLTDRAVLLGNIGWLYSELGQTDRALAYHRDALFLFDRLGHHEGQASSYLGLAEASDRGGESEAAFGYAETALEWIERVVETGQTFDSPGDVRVSYLSSRRPYFDRSIQLAMDLHHLDPEAGFDELALTISEQARARHLLEILASKPIDSSGGPDLEMLERQRRLRDEINVLDRRLRLGRMDRAKDDPRSLEQNLQGQLRAYRRSMEAVGQTGPFQVPVHPPRPMVLQMIRELLDPATVLLEYHLGEERSFLWVVGRDDTQSFQLPPGPEIDRLARRTHSMLKRSDRVNFRVPAERDLQHLSRIVLGPLSEVLRGQRLVIVADGALQYIPFSALPTPDGDAVLVEDHEIVQLPSIAVLALLRHRAETRSPGSGFLALIADPVYERGDPRLPAPGRPGTSPATSPLGRIPFSGREAERILELADGAGSVLAALGPEASRDRVVGGDLADYRILHFATHGLLREDSPELSALLLTRFDPAGRSVEGRLMLNEVYALDLAADLVVLSACRSALGREIRGEGLMGLPRGFLYAGASRVLASLWQVHDESTAVLMTRFYRHMLADGLAPPAALREAQVSMMREPRYTPYHWAGFVIQGDWRSPRRSLANR